MVKAQPEGGALSDFRITFRFDWAARVRSVVLSGDGVIDSFAAGKGGSHPARMGARITADAVAVLKRMEGVISVDRIQ